MMLNIIFFATIYPIMFLMWLIYSMQNKYENGYLFAVNMKKEWLNDSAVAGIQQKFKKEMRNFVLVLALIPFISLLTSHMSIQITIWMLWLLIAIALLTLPIMRANHRLKAWKLQTGRYEEAQMGHYVELKQAGTIRKVRFFPFFLPNGIALASSLLLFSYSIVFGVSCLVGASCGLIYWIAAVWIDHQPVSVISTNSDININYTRAKKNLWKNFWLICCWLNTMLILFLEILIVFAPHMQVWTIIGMIVYGLLLLFLCIPFTLKLKAIDRAYAGKHDLTSDVNDDRHWIGGMFYYNPNDSHTMVEQRIGIGTTVNMATPLGKGLTIFSAVVMLCIPFICVWIIVDEFTPIDLIIRNQTLCAEHLKTDYEIPVGKIEDLTLLTASELPDWSKSYGTAMDTLEKGQFTISGGKDCTVFLNPQNNRFLRFQVNGKSYYMGGVDDAQTTQVYETLQNTARH